MPTMLEALLIGIILGIVAGVIYDHFTYGGR